MNHIADLKDRAEWDLNLNGDAFNALKNDFNMILKRTLSNMETKGSEAAEMTVKLKISFQKEPTPLGDNTMREMTLPKFDHKVSSVLQIKNETAGTLGGEYELLWDSERGEYVLRQIQDPQMSIFDSPEIDPVWADGEVVRPAPLLLPMNDDDGNDDATCFCDSCHYFGEVNRKPWCFHADDGGATDPEREACEHYRERGDDDEDTD